MAVVLAVESASVAIFGFLSGNLAARLGARRTMLIADAARAPLVALIPILHAFDVLSFALLLVLAAAIAAFATPSFAAKSSILPELVGEDEGVSPRRTRCSRPHSDHALHRAGARGRADRRHRRDECAAHRRRLVRARRRARRHARARGWSGRAGCRVPRARGGLPLPRPRSPPPSVERAIVLGDVAWTVLFAAMPVLVIERFGEDPALLGWIWGAWGSAPCSGTSSSFRTVACSDRLLISSIGEIAMIAPLWLLLLDIPPLGARRRDGRVGVRERDHQPTHSHDLPAREPACPASEDVVRGHRRRPRSGPGRARGRAVLDADGYVPVVVALVAVQSVAAIAFMTAGLRERARAGEAVTA